MEGQASVIAAEIAEKLGGEYRMIHLPDTLDADALKEMLKMDEVRETVDLIRRANVVIHGIGRADVMAQKRHLPPAVMGLLREGGAVGEAFGVFFDALGRPVYRLETGSGDHTSSAEARVLAAACGTGKAEAVIACMRYEKHCGLITDESTAKAMLSILEADAPLP
jgi:central glycolytic genes regulator